MTWVKLDDQFFMNPKSLAAGKDGRELYLSGLCYCAAEETDGWIATVALPVVAARAGVKVSQARVLERVGLWEEGIGGWWVHDFLKYNPSAAEVRDRREKRAAAGAKGGSNKAGKHLASALANAKADASDEPRTASEPPFPVPSPNPHEGQILSVEVVDFRLERGLG